MPQGAVKLKRRGLKAAQDIVLEYSRQQLPPYIEKLLDELIELTEQGTFVGSQHEYFYAGAKVKESQKQITEAFQEYFKTTFKEFSARTLADIDSLLGTKPELALIEEDALEERVVLTSIRQRAEGRFREALWALNQRFSLLNDGIPVDEQLNPLAPVRFCLALQQSLQCIDISVATKAQLYRIFEHTFIDHLGVMYKEVNLALIELGMLPNLRHSVVKAAEKMAPGMSMPMDGHHEPGDSWLGGGGRMAPQVGTPGYHNYHQQLYANISALQDRVHWVGDSQERQTPEGGVMFVPQVTFATGVDPSGAGDVGMTGLPIINYSFADLSSALQKLQRVDLEAARRVVADQAELQPRPAGPVSESLVQQLNALIGKDQETAADIKVPDQKTIDLVGMIFRYMLKDTQLPHSVKTLISYLHMPCLKVAFADSELFAQPEHPVRQLLNRLAEAGTRWVSDEKRDATGVYGRINEIVERLLENVDSDVKPYEEELASFNIFLKRLEAKASIMEKRVAEQAQGEDRLKKSKDQVRIRIKKLIGERELPGALLTFLLQPWTDYVVFVLLRHGEQSDQWKAAIKVVNDLFRGLVAGEDERKSKRWKNGYPALKEAINKGFDAIGYEEGSRREMLEAMDNVYQKCLKKSKVRPASKREKKKLVEQFEEGLIDLHQQRKALSALEEQYLEQLQEVSFGTWFEDQQGKREKVSWYNLDTMQFLFVDQRGHRSGVKSGIELAQMMASGALKVVEIDERPLVDRTLEQIYADLCGADAQLENTG